MEKGENTVESKSGPARDLSRLLFVLREPAGVVNSNAPQSSLQNSTIEC